MKMKVVVSYEIDVNPEWYPTNVNTIDEICEFEQNNESFIESIIMMLSEKDVNISIQPVH